MAPIRERKKRYCHFCKTKEEPDYKEVDTIKKFTSERKKIVNRSRTGVCSKHQRRLTLSIKRARIIATLPFVPTI